MMRKILLAFAFVSIFLFSFLIPAPSTARASTIGVPQTPPNLPIGGQSTSATTTFTGLDQGLVGYWTMDGKDINWTSDSAGTIRDKSGNGNTGTLVGLGRATSTVAGKVGQAVRFDGVGEANINISSVSIPVSSNKTISVWVKPTNLTDSNFIMDTSNGRLVVALRDTGSVTSIAFYDGSWKQTNVAADLNKWQHLAFVFVGTTAKIYKNGRQIGGDQAYTQRGITIATRLGSNNTGIYGSNPNLLKGSLDDVRVYSRALSASEVKQLYDQGAGNKVSVAPAPKNLPQNGGATAATSTWTGLNRGLVGYWTMDGKDINWTSASAGTIRDKSGNGNTGTLVGMPKTSSPKSGKIGQALSFDGVSASNITVSSSTAFNMVSSYTVSLWYKMKATNTYVPLVSRSGTWAQNGWGLGTGNNSNTLRFWMDNVDGNYTEVSLPSMNSWHHAVGIYNNGVLTLYVDGKVAGTPTAHTAVSSNVGNVMMEVGSGSNRLNGSLDDVRIYNRALSASEIKQLYDQGAGSKVSVAPAPKNLPQNGGATAATSTFTGLNRGLVGYWTMDGKDINWTSASAGTIRDKSGNGNTGTFIGLNRTTNITSGKFGQSMKFFGLTNSQVSISSPSAGLSSANVTISLWSKPTNITADQYVTYGVASVDSNKRAVVLGYQDNYFNIFNNGAYPTGTAADTLIPATKGSWQHIVFSSDGSRVYGYKNGVLVFNVAGNLNITGASTVLSSYSLGTNGGNHYYGSLDDVRIYNRALSASEIKQLYNIGR